MRLFKFTDEVHPRRELTVRVSEQADPAYGMYVWPCAVVLAQYIWFNRKSLLVGKNVVELGAGTSLPGVVAAICGGAASVTLTDDNHQPSCIENCARTCAANSVHVSTHENCARTSAANSVPVSTQVGGSTMAFQDVETLVRIIGLTWGEVAPSQFGSQNSLPFPDVILGSDCFFDESVYEKLLFTVRYLLEGRMSSDRGSDQPKFICTYQVRSTKSTFDDLLLLWDLQCKEIDLGEFGADCYDIAGSGMPGNHDIKLYEIAMNNSS